MEEETLTKKEKRALRKEAKKEEREKTQRRGSMKRISVWGAVIVAIVGVVFGLVKLSEPPTTDTGEPITAVSITDEDHAKGSQEQKVVLTEYGDFQCPACAGYHPLVKLLESEFDDEVTFVFRHFPLFSIHANAEAASFAAEAAGAQNKFWEMHDRLFEAQAQWSDLTNPKEKFDEIATDLGIELDQFSSDYESDEVRDRVRSSYDSGVAIGVNSTPSFFLNGRKLRLPLDLDDFKDEINRELEKAS